MNLIDEFLTSDFISVEETLSGVKVKYTSLQPGRLTELKEARIDHPYVYFDKTKFQFSLRNKKIFTKLLKDYQERIYSKEATSLTRDLVVKNKLISYYFVIRGTFIKLPGNVPGVCDSMHLSKMADAIFTSEGKVLKMRGEPLRNLIQELLFNDFKDIKVHSFETLGDAIFHCDRHLEAVLEYNKYCHVTNSLF